MHAWGSGDLIAFACCSFGIAWSQALTVTTKLIWIAWINYSQRAVLAAFDHFWKDQDLRVHYANSLAEVARRFANHPAVIGFDLMNEPFYGTTLPYIFETQYLHPFHGQCRDAIRAVAPDATIFFEPPAFPTASGLPSLLPKFNDSNAVYAPHYYDPLVHEGFAYQGYKQLIDFIIRNKAIAAERHGVPIMLGEFGVAPETNSWDLYLKHLLAACDKYGVSWTAWSYDRGGGFSVLEVNGDERQNLQHMVRAYPQAVAGFIERWSFDRQTARFNLSFANSTATGATEIFIPRDRLFNGTLHVQSSDPPGSWSWSFDPNRQILSYFHDVHSVRHEITVTP